MTGARLKAIALATAVLFAVLGGGAPRILCIGPGGHAALEETLCGAFATGTSCCPTEGPATLALPCSRAAAGGVECSEDACIDTVLHPSAITATPQSVPGPAPCAAPPAKIVPSGDVSPSRPAAVPPSLRHDPPIPLDTRTTLLI